MPHRARYVLLALVVGAASATLIVAQRRRLPPTPSPSSHPASRPASRPPARYPSDELIAACNKAAERLRGRLDRTFRISVSPPFVVAGDCSAERLEAYAAHSVVSPAEVMWRSYFRKKPTGVITILLLAGDGSYRRWAKELFGDTDLPHYGYCRSDGTMVMNIETGSGTLVHELTHALIRYDFPAVPDWFNEGLGSLHEQCGIEPGRIVGYTNWRLPALQETLRAGKLRPLRRLVTADDFYGSLRGTNYAQARYFILYAQQQGLLEKLYATLHDLYEPGDDDLAADAGATADAGSASASRPAMAGAATKPRDVAAIERTFGRDIDEIDAACRKWILTLRFR